MAEKKYYGIYQGVVTNINDPEKRARIKVICPDVLGGEVESAWCDPVVTVAYDNGGDFCLPAKDETVWIQFIAGDANRPVYLGGWWQKNMTPLGSSYSNIDKIRIIKYADCTIVMQNGKIDINTGSGAFDLRIEDKKLTINGDLEVIGNIHVTENVTVDKNVSAISMYGSGSGGVMQVDAIKANSVSAGSVTASGVSLSSHTHTGVHGETSGPK